MPSIASSGACAVFADGAETSFRVGRGTDAVAQARTPCGDLAGILVARHGAVRLDRGALVCLHARYSERTLLRADRTAS